MAPDRPLGQSLLEGGYSYTRLAETLRVFRTAEGQAAEGSNNIAQPSRTSTRLANSNDEGCKSPDKSGPLADDDDEEDDGDSWYDPCVSSVQIKNRGATKKRKAEAAPEGESLKKKSSGDNKPSDESDDNHNASEEEPVDPPTSALLKKDRLTDKNSYLTFAFISAKNRKTQKALAEQHRNDITMVPPPGRKAPPTYTEKLDAEVAELPNEAGRVLRSGKLVEPVARPENHAIVDKDALVWKPMCPRCRRDEEDKCICHEALIPVKKDTRSRKLSHVPVEFRPQARQPTRTPSVKGKERGPTMSPEPDMLTPSPTTSHTSAFSVPPSQTPTFNLPSPTSNTSSPVTTLSHQSTGAQDDPIDLDSDDEANWIAKELTIRTRWSHPINFRFIAGKTCKFCRDFRYGVVGGISRVVTVIQDPSSSHLQYIEIAGQSPQPAQTQMCVSCALDRLYIIRCPGHFFERTPALSAGTRDEFISNVFKGQAAPKPIAPMCSLCTRPARIRCCASQKHDKTYQDMTEPNSVGCGLYLCGTCKCMFDRIGGKFRKGAVESYTRAANAAQTHSMMLRADAEFLFCDSLLQKAYAGMK